MKVVTVITSQNGDLREGMRGLLRGPGPQGCVAVLFPKLTASAFRKTGPVTVAMWPGEFTLSDNATDLPFLVSATLPPALLI